MSYRFVIKRIASRALSSAVAQGLLKLDTDALWDRFVRGEKLPLEQLETLKADVEETLRTVEARGRQEREMMMEALKELANQILRGGRPR